MTTRKKKIPVWLIVLGIIVSCIFISLSIGRYTIVNVREPAWSPDGKSIAFACRPRNTLDRLPDHLDPLSLTYGDQIYGICIKDLTTGDISWITRRLGMHTPTWSPDGQRLAWLDNYNTLVVWNKKTKKSVRYPLDDTASIISWSLDGQRIFLQWNNAWLDLNLGELVYFENDHINYFSPTGQFAVYVDGKGLSAHTSHMVVLNTQTNQIIYESYIASSLYSISLYRISWSPDGSILAWEAVPERGNVQLGLTKVSTGETSFLFINNLGAPTHDPWSPKGDSIILQSIGQEWDDIKILNVVCENAPFHCKIVGQKTYKPKFWSPDFFVWSQDGKKIAYQFTDSLGPIRIIDLETNQDYPLIEISK